MMAKGKSMVMGTRFVPGFVCRDLTREPNQWGFGCNYASVVRGDTHDWW